MMRLVLLPSFSMNIVLLHRHNKTGLLVSQEMGKASSMLRPPDPRRGQPPERSARPFRDDALLISNFYFLIYQVPVPCYSSLFILHSSLLPFTPSGPDGKNGKWYMVNEIILHSIICVLYIKSLYLQQKR